MLSFKQFLTENPYEPRKVEPRALVAWCESKAPQYLKRMAKYPIFRGMDAPYVGIIDTNGMNRTSANTLNYYTIWMDNDKDWEGWPKRSKALICSTDYSYADGFGEVNFVIPSDSAKIGICADADLWTSFEFRNMRMGLKDREKETMDEFVYMTRDFISSTYKGDDKGVLLKKAGTDYATLVDALKRVKPEDVAEYSKVLSGEAKGWVNAFEKNGYKDLYDLWRDVMQPEENDFQQTTGAAFKAQRDREVWVQGECAVINYDYLYQAKSDEDHPLHDFFYTYDLFKMAE